MGVATPAHMTRAPAASPGPVPSDQQARSSQLPNDDPRPGRAEAAAGALAVTADEARRPAAESARRASRTLVPAVAQHSQLVARVDRPLEIRTGRGTGPVIGVMPAASVYLGAPMSAWIEHRSADGRWGYVHVPWRARQRGGWVSLSGLTITSSQVVVVASRAERRVRVFRHGQRVIDAPATIGAPSSPTPVGSFFVTDLVPVSPPSRSYGSFAFGISAIQPHTPAGWTGGNQMAIHGTGDPSSIGRAVSAGCLRVSESTLARLRAMLVPGTPVVIEP